MITNIGHYVVYESGWSIVRARVKLKSHVFFFYFEKIVAYCYNTSHVLHIIWLNVCVCVGAFKSNWNTCLQGVMDLFGKWKQFLAIHCF